MFGAGGVEFERERHLPERGGVETRDRINLHFEN